MLELCFQLIPWSLPPSEYVPLIVPSYMLCPSNHLPSHSRPVDAIIEIFFNQTTYRNIVTPDEIKAMANFGAWFWVVLRANDSFDGFVQDNVGNLVAGEQGAN